MFGAVVGGENHQRRKRRMRRSAMMWRLKSLSQKGRESSGSSSVGNPTIRNFVRFVHTTTSKRT